MIVWGARVGRIAREKEREKGRGKRRGKRAEKKSEKGGEERREATKTMKRKLDGAREKAQKEGRGGERASEREKEAANTVGLPSHLAHRDCVAGHRRAEGNCRRSRARVVESFVRVGTGKRREKGGGRAEWEDWVRGPRFKRE